jgi:hypothetical protein
MNLLYTEQELRNLHMRLGHPFANKTIEFISRAGGMEPGVLEIVKKN